MFGRFKTFVSEKIETIKAEIDNNEKAKSTPPPPAIPVNPSPTASPLRKVENNEPELSIPWKTSLDSILPLKTTTDIEDSDIPLSLWKTNITATAGQYIIRRYENMWNDCHENNIDLGRAAERADRNLRSAISSANKHHKALRELEKTLQGLPAFLDKINKAKRQVSNLKTRMDTLEFAFDSIARERGKKNFEEWKKQLTGNVFDYKQAKEKELHQLEYKLRVEKQRADRDEEIQQNLKRLQEAREKQQERLRKEEEQRKEKLRKEEEQRVQEKAFQDAFQKQLNDYKSGATTTKSSNDKEQNTTLEQFDLEVDNSELLSFLGDDDDVPVGVDKSLVGSDDEGETVEVIPVIEDPEAEYQRYLTLELENIVGENESTPSDSVSSLLDLSSAVDKNMIEINEDETEDKNEESNKDIDESKEEDIQDDETKKEEVKEEEE